jgi:hypothetical protein
LNRIRHDRSVHSSHSIAVAGALALVCAAALCACSSTAAAPGIDSFTATPSSVPQGTKATLAWSITGATSISIDNGVGDVTGKTSVDVTPSTTTTYQVKAQGADAATFSTAKVTVTVTAAVPAPVISAFTANPPAISAGGTSTLSWTVANATSLQIDNGVGDVTGTSSTTVTPTATTTYTLKAVGAGGQVTATATVSLVAAGLTLNYTNPTSATAKLLLIKNVARSTPTHLVLDVTTGAAAIPAAFGVAMNLPLDHTKATFTFTTGVTGNLAVPVGAPLQPGTGAGATLAGLQPLTGPLADFLTVGVARKKAIASDGDVILPANTVLFSVALDAVSTAPAGTVFDGSALPAAARLAALKRDGTEAAGKADFAVGLLFITR